MKVTEGIKDDLNKKNDIISPWFGRLNIVKMAILPKEIYIFYVISMIIPTTVFTKMKKLIQKFVWNYKRSILQPEQSRIGKSKLEDSFLYFKTYYNATLIKSEWYWNKNWHMDQYMDWQCRINPYIILDKDVKVIQQAMNSLFNKWCWDNWISRHKRIALGSYFTPYEKVNMDQSSKCKRWNYKTLQKNIGTNLHDLRLGNGFLDMLPAIQTTK